jgi:hypothetical protein
MKQELHELVYQMLESEPRNALNENKNFGRR